MLMSTRQNNKKFGITLLTITIVIIGILLFLWRTLIMSSGNTIDYIFQGYRIPNISGGDMNHDGAVNIIDLTMLITFLFHAD